MPTLTPTATMLYFPLSGASAAGRTVANWRAARLTLANDYTWFWTQNHNEVIQDDGTLLGSPMEGWVHSHFRDVRAVNPSIKCGVYVGGMANVDSIYPQYEWLTDDDIIHDDNGDSAEQHVNNPPNSYRQTLVNFSRPETRAKLVNGFSAYLAENNIDGIFFDTYDPRFYATYADSFFGLSGGSVDGDVLDPMWWTEAIFLFAQELKARLTDEGREVWIVGLGDAGFDHTDPVDQAMGRYNSNAAGIVDGIIDESIYLAWNSTTVFREHLEAIDLVSLRGSQTFVNCLPRLLAPSQPTENDATRRWFLATYLLVKSAYTFFGYHPYTAYQGADDSNAPFVYTHADWDLDIGEPTGSWQTNATGATTIYYREFVLPNTKNVYAVVNPHATLTGTFGVNGSYKDWHPSTGTPITVSGASYTVSARGAHLLFEQ